MNISSLSSFDYSSAAGSTASGKSKQSNPLENLLNRVESDLQSGNTSDASSLISTMLSNAPQGTGNGSSGSDPISTINNYLQSLQGALSSGNTSDAQSILSNLNNYLSQNPPPGMGGSGAQGAGSASGQNPLSKTLSDISSDLQSGDTSDAQNLVSTLLSHGPPSSDTTSSTASTSGASTITDFLSSLESALSSNNTTDASSILTNLQSYLSQHSHSHNNSSGTYSADGTLSSSSSQGTLSALI